VVSRNRPRGPAGPCRGPVSKRQAAASLYALTATDAFSVRGHGVVPQVAQAGWRLRVHGLVERELDLSLTTLREAFVQRTLTATLLCAGNRRAGLMANATSRARRRGVGARLAPRRGPGSRSATFSRSPARCGRPARGFEGADLCPEANPAQRVGGSIPLDQACRPEVLLAWAMNGEPLTPVHGAPLRVVVPG
jgi:sulfite oxidase